MKGGPGGSIRSGSSPQGPMAAARKHHGNTEDKHQSARQHAYQLHEPSTLLRLQVPVGGKTKGDIVHGFTIRRFLPCEESALQRQTHQHDQRPAEMFRSSKFLVLPPPGVNRRCFGTESKRWCAMASIGHLEHLSDHLS